MAVLDTFVAACVASATSFVHTLHAELPMTIQQTPGHVLPARSAAKMEAAMAVGAFAIGTGEFAIMGLMPDIAQNLGLSEPQVGHAISAYALGVMVGAPLLAILGAT